MYASLPLFTDKKCFVQRSLEMAEKTLRKEILGLSLHITNSTPGKSVVIIKRRKTNFFERHLLYAL